ncbi:MAG: PTS sugar transporter subunit IIA [Archangiaceae bacterium]|nr:PTS sugar transporter subunit IIA [Archangiaceae bacterium]
MIGLVVATHGRLGHELLATTEQIVGPLACVTACSVEPGASADELRDRIREAVARVDQGDGVLVLADLAGGSPCTQSMALCSKQNLEVVSGVNLPMVIKASSLRNEGHSVNALAQALVQYGQRNITLASALLRDALRAQAH